MCTLIVAWRVFDDVAIAAVANRDEALDRPSQPPTTWASDPAILAPRDLEAGGTWIGVNEHGLLVAITNRWVDTGRSPTRSRGQLVVDALGEQRAVDALATVERAVSRDAYDGFNLVLADSVDASYLEWDGSLHRRSFDPGVHVVVNVGADDEFDPPPERRSIGERQAENARRVAEALAVEEESAESWLDRATDVVSDHEYGVCVHGDGFGTRSSSAILLADDGSVTVRFADGPPCVTDYRLVSPEGQL